MFRIIPNISWARQFLVDLKADMLRVNGKTYPYKEKLKEIGYRFMDGCWTKKINSEDEVIQEIKLLSNIAQTDFLFTPDRWSKANLEFFKKLEKAGGVYFERRLDGGPPYEISWEEFWAKYGGGLEF